MYEIQTDHQIVAFGPDLMRLFTSATGDIVVEATRSGSVWTIHAEGVSDVTAPDRAAALAEMPQHAFASLGPSGPGGRGYSTLIPHGLAELS